MKEYISRIQAQRILGCDKATMMKLLRSGEIVTSRKENGGWLVLYDSLEEYIQRRVDQAANIAELQKKIAVYKEENRILKQILKDNGIQYEPVLDDGGMQTFVPNEFAIVDLDLPPRALCALDLAGVHSVDQLRKMTAHDLLCLKGIGKKAVAAIESQLALYGIELRKY